MTHYRTLAVLCVLALAGCSQDPLAPQNIASNLAFNPSAPGAGFIPAATVAEQQTLAQQIWAQLSDPACWDASAIIQGAQPVGSVSQFTFHTNNQYRHYGFSVNFGTVPLHQVGTYQGLRTAIVETWTGEIEALVLVNNQEIAHVYPHINGAIIVLRYGRSGGPCL